MQQNSPSLKTLSTIFSLITLFGLLVLIIGMYLLTVMIYHERAYVPLGIGAACFIGGLAGLIVRPSRLKVAACYGVIALGMLALVVGLNYLTYPFQSYQIRGYIVIGTGILCLLGGITGAIAFQPEAKKVACYSALVLGVIASLGIVGLIVGLDQLIAFAHSRFAIILVGSGSVCFLGGVAATIIMQRRMHRYRAV